MSSTPTGLSESGAEVRVRAQPHLWVQEGMATQGWAVAVEAAGASCGRGLACVHRQV